MNRHLIFSVFTSRPNSLLECDRAAMFFFVVFKFWPLKQHQHKPETDVSHKSLLRETKYTCSQLWKWSRKVRTYVHCVVFFKVVVTQLAKDRYHVYKDEPLDSVRRQLQPVHTLMSYFYKIHVNFNVFKIQRWSHGDTHTNYETPFYEISFAADLRPVPHVEIFSLMLCF